jgi:ferredoxin-thioredoxin reductase catalytic subunit
VISLEKIRQRAESDARTSGCYLNPDQDFLRDLFEGIMKNEERYGYPFCPCRRATGKLDLDADVICPCAYRDIDVLEYGCCYCALFVRKDVFEGKTSVNPIPERRPKDVQIRAYGVSGVEAAREPIEKPAEAATAVVKEPLEVGRKAWYCRQCGYVCFREEPPYVCPICKAKKEMFAPLKIQAEMHS